MATLGIDPDKVCYLIVRARQFHAKVEAVEPDPGSNVSDDGFREILEDYDDDPIVIEMRQFIESLDEEEYANLLALMWIGRGDYAVDEWNDVLAEARALEDERGADYLIGTPLVGDYLEEGLSQMGYSCEDFEEGRL
ncbi:MAG TPA: DUF3775 domain-containing protein [Alphaproteobacteria bacterium]